MNKDEAATPAKRRARAVSRTGLWITLAIPLLMGIGLAAILMVVVYGAVAV